MGNTGIGRFSTTNNQRKGRYDYMYVGLKYAFLWLSRSS